MSTWTSTVAFAEALAIGLDRAFMSICLRAAMALCNLNDFLVAIQENVNRAGQASTAKIRLRDVGILT